MALPETSMSRLSSVPLHGHAGPAEQAPQPGEPGWLQRARVSGLLSIVRGACLFVGIVATILFSLLAMRHTENTSHASASSSTTTSRSSSQSGNTPSQSLFTQGIGSDSGSSGSNGFSVAPSTGSSAPFTHSMTS